MRVQASQEKRDFGGDDRGVAAALLLAAVLARVSYAFRYRVDTDEPQHLHVAWAWAHGLVQYRDVFDNHTPLFHLLTAPLVGVLGERPDIVPLMRLAMLPGYVAVLWCTYRLACRLYSPRVAWWAAVLVAWMPPFFLCSLEFRADDLWTPLWLLTLVVAVDDVLSPRRAFLAGVIAGAAIATSMKTTLLLATLAVAVVTALVVVRNRERSARDFAGFVVRFAIGAAIVPALIVAGFAGIGALQPFFYGTIGHNVLPGIGTWRHGPLRMLVFPTTILIATVVAAAVARRTANTATARRRVVLLVATAAYGSALAGVWPVITREDYLPFYPLLAVFVAPALLAVLPRRRVAWAPIAVVAVELFALFHDVPPWVNQAAEEEAFVADVLQLTDTSEPVFDYKGESIFRTRPFYWVYERLTKTRLDRGLIADTVPETLVATSTHVAVHDHRDLSERTRRFLDDHYLPVGNLRVAGQRLPCAEDAPAAFDLAIAGRYRVLPAAAAAPPSRDGDGAASPTSDGAGAPAPDTRLMAEIDGTAAGGFLAAGPHELRTRHCRGGVLLVWAPALERGFAPIAAVTRVDDVRAQTVATGGAPAER